MVFIHGGLIIQVSLYLIVPMFTGPGTRCDRDELGLTFNWYRFTINNVDAYVPTACVEVRHQSC